MKRDLDLVLKDPYGKPFTEGGMTLGKAMAQSLMTAMPEDGKQSVDEKMNLYRLLQRVVVGGVQEFSSDELSMIKKRAALHFSLAGFGAVADALDRDFVPPPKAVEPGTPEAA